MTIGTLAECFETLEDPRMVNKCQHNLLDIIVIAICAVVANADGWEDIALFAESKADWLGQWLALPNGIPSADTIRRVFMHLEAEAFEQCFMEWVRRAFELTDGQVIAIDGKTVRGTCDKRGQGGLHLVSAWATANGLTLGQVKVGSKTNEIVAIPDLLELLVVKGCIVTLDAMGCHKEIVNDIRRGQADYVVTVKANQPTLHDSLQAAFAAQDEVGWSALPDSFARTEDTAHSRDELRQCWVLADQTAQALGWRDCQSLVRIERLTLLNNDTIRHETHFYISSLPPQAARLLHAVRDHWAIENRCHWVLDVVFHEDASRTHIYRLDHNLAILRKFALNLLRHSPGKNSLKAKRYRAALNDDFLVDVLKSSFNLMR